MYEIMKQREANLLENLTVLSKFLGEDDPYVCTVRGQWMAYYEMMREVELK